MISKVQVILVDHISGIFCNGKNFFFHNTTSCGNLMGECTNSGTIG